jgi:hypothetical protein
MEQVHVGGAVLEQAEVQELVGLAGEERVDPEQGRVRKGSVYVPNVEPLFPMRLEYPVSIGSAPNVEKRW